MNFSFFDVHTHAWLLLLGLAIFPRITLLLAGGPFGLLHWVGWFFAPHLLVAILATSRYWETNPALCIVAWFMAFAGTGSEGRVAKNRGWRRARGVTVKVAG